MSRSFKRRPFMSCCGDNSAKRDKQLAHRGERRAHSRAIHLEMKVGGDFENFVPPHRLECSWNNTYSWNRDGSQMYMVPSPRDWEDYLKGEDTWPPQWYQHMMRK